ncbi:CLUMA_CG006697, isoform A [Clunio marinus]|uniref:CLUMA_CG006697, isoform A n=1 Tax=Clunio marinus TaxID=568069 RepID=A0A1J1HYB9_9DIPT|nr:CLUMA_CG006697, isoform A [Clunio marinus]
MVYFHLSSLIKEHSTKIFGFYKTLQLCDHFIEFSRITACDIFNSLYDKTSQLANEEYFGFTIMRFKCLQ